MSLPEHLVEEFWGHVEQELKNKEMPDVLARIADIRRQLAIRPEHDQEAIYHREPADVAEAIFDGGYVNPVNPNANDAREEFLHAHPDLSWVFGTGNAAHPEQPPAA